MNIKRYTYLLDISDLQKCWNNFEKRTKYEIKKCRENVFVSNDIDKFDYLHRISRPDRKINKEFILKTFQEKQPNCKIYATITAMAMFSWDKKKGYYLLAGRDKLMKPDGSPSKIIWQAIQDLNKMGIKEFNFCGANKSNIKMFKRGFGGRLVLQKKPCLIY